jgi:hypothetical protein
MIKFLTTQGLNYYIEELLKNADVKIVLTSPFIKFHRRIKEILINKKKQGVEIHIVCRVSDLQESISEYCTKIFDVPTLHAKCYMSEREAILTSLNLYEFSQLNNEEMGVYVKDQNDGSVLFREIRQEVERFCKENKQNQSEADDKNDPCLVIGKKYSAFELQQIFKFDYQGPAGIKESSSGNIVLFSNTGGNPYTDRKEGDIIYYQGQNTGAGEQKLIYGNKLLYNCYGKSGIRVFMFQNYTYIGEYTVAQEPYFERGKWIFPLSKKMIISENTGRF